MANVNDGLDGVVVAETRLSHVDGLAGRLVIAGSDVEALAGHVSFEGVFARLLYADAHREAEVSRALGEARQIAWQRIAHGPAWLSLPNGMDAIRAATACSTDERPESIVGALAVFAAAWTRKSAGGEPMAPDPALGHAHDYVRMIRGSAVAEPLARAMDAYFVTVSDHGMNASTFAARVIASTGSDMVSSVTGAIGALKGPLHGGAPGPVLDMLDAIGDATHAEAWIKGEIDGKRRIMGMGHRIYRVRDPRAAVLERELRKLESTHRLLFAREVERTAERQLQERHPDRPLRANVEFYTAVLLEAIGIPRAAFSPTFGVARAAGWCAHVVEQRKVGRLIRPSSNYIGPMPE